MKEEEEVDGNEQVLRRHSGGLTIVTTATTD